MSAAVLVNPTPTQPVRSIGGLQLVPTPRVTAEEAERELDIAREFVVNSPDSRLEAEGAMLRIKSLEDVVSEEHDPECKRRYDEWKEATAARAKLTDPLEAARKAYGTSVGKWDATQRKLREEEQVKALIAERRRSEEQREESIVLAEAAGETSTEVATLCDMPLTVAPVILPAAIPTSAVGTKPVTKGKVTNLFAFVRHAAAPGNEHIANLLEVNEGALNKLISATGGKIQLPGVQLYTEYSSTTRRKR